MSDISTLEKIKAREESAEKELSDAKESAMRIVSEAKQRSDATLAEAAKKGQEMYQAALAAAEREAAEKAAEISAQNEERINSLRDVGPKDAMDVFDEVVREEFGV